MTTRHTPHTPLSKRVLAEPSTLLGRLFMWGVLLYAALVAFYLMVFRLRVRRLNYAVCIFSKHVLNLMMMFLDRRHWYAAVLRNKGRRSGRDYATPVTAEPTQDGYVIPSPTGKMLPGSRCPARLPGRPSRLGKVLTSYVNLHHMAV